MLLEPVIGYETFCVNRKRLSQEMGRVERTRELARRRSRRSKLKKLRTNFAKSKSDGEKAEIATKARKISPFVSFEE